MSSYSLPRIGAVLLLLSGLGLVWTAPAAAQAGDVTMTVTPYLGGHVKYGEWLPLRIGLSNGGDDFVAEVQAEIAGNSGQVVYAAPAPLPAGARKEVDLYVLPPTYGQSITVRLVQGDQVLAKAEVNVSPHPQSEYLIAAIALDSDAFAPLKGLDLPGRSQTQVISLSLDGLPERAEALRSLDFLILTGIDTSPLTPVQGEALRAWVELGGRLLIGGGAGVQRTLAGLPESLRPAQLDDPVELAKLDGLASFAGEPVRVSGPFLAAFPADYQGWPVVSQDEQPLLVQKALGDGWVAYLALDPSASPFDAWAGALPFWRKLLEPGSAWPAGVPQDIPLRMLESEQMNYALSNLPSLDLPSIRWLALLLGLYIVLVGPVNYLLLRRLRRLDWAWLTIPALTLAFSVVGFGMGYGLRGNDLILNQISIVPISAEGGQALVRSYVGLVSPTRADYSVRVGGDALISPMSSYNWGGWDPSTAPSTDALDVLQGDPAVVRGLGVNQWSMQSFQAETWLETGGLKIDADLTIEGDQVRGTIHNNLGRPLREIVLLSGHRYAQLGDLDAGQGKEIEAALQGGGMGSSLPWSLFENYFQGPNPPPREVTLRQSILEAYFHTNWGMGVVPPSPDLTLLAWTDLSPLDMQVVDARATQLQTTLVVAHLALPVTNGRVTLPPGFLSGQLVESGNDVSMCGTANQVYLGHGQAVLEYQLPAALRALEPEALSLHVSSDGGSVDELPSLSLYDWTAGEWVEMKGVEMGRQYDVADPGRFVNPAGGAIRLQVQQEEWMQGWCYQFDLGLEGELLPEGGSQ